MTIPNVAVRLRRDLTIALQLGMVAAANILGFCLRFDGMPPPWALTACAQMLPWLIVIRALVFVPFRLYDGMWRYTSLYDLRGIAGAVATSSALFYLVVKSLVIPRGLLRGLTSPRAAAAGRALGDATLGVFVPWRALDKYRGHYYAKCQNLARRLRAAYDAVLAEHDLLLMPTLPLKATPIPGPGAPRMEIIQRAFEMLPNTAPFDVTGHPSMSVPCGLSDGLPAGMMLTAKHFDEVSIYRAASAFEKAGDWREIRP